MSTRPGAQRSPGRDGATSASASLMKIRAACVRRDFWPGICGLSITNSEARACFSTAGPCCHLAMTWHEGGTHEISDQKIRVLTFDCAHVQKIVDRSSSSIFVQEELKAAEAEAGPGAQLEMQCTLTALRSYTAFGACIYVHKNMLLFSHLLALLCVLICHQFGLPV